MWWREPRSNIKRSSRRAVSEMRETACPSSDSGGGGGSWRGARTARRRGTKKRVLGDDAAINMLGGGTGSRIFAKAHLHIYTGKRMQNGGTLGGGNPSRLTTQPHPAKPPSLELWQRCRSSATRRLGARPEPAEPTARVGAAISNFHKTLRVKNACSPRHLTPTA